MYNVLFISDAQQSESDTYIYLLFFGFPSRLGHQRALSRYFLLHMKFSLVTYFIDSRVYTSISLSSPLPSPLISRSLFSAAVTLSANKFIYTIFLDSTQKLYCTIFAFLFLTHFTLYDTF